MDKSYKLLRIVVKIMEWLAYVVGVLGVVSFFIILIGGGKLEVVVILTRPLIDEVLHDLLGSLLTANARVVVLEYASPLLQLLTIFHDGPSSKWWLYSI